MNKYIYYILMGIMIVLTIKNFKKVKENSQGSDYIECYRKIIANEADAADFAEEYLGKETNPQLISKANIMVLCDRMEKGLDYAEALEKIDVKGLFMDDKGFSQFNYDNNSDAFLWMILAMAKAKRLGKIDVVEKLYTGINEVSELKAYMEYQLTLSYYNVLSGNKDMSFIDTLLTGDYSNYLYNKKTIGLDKRFAEALKAYVGEELDELSLADIPGFADTALGAYLMKDLGIYDKYVVKEEASYLEDTEEENKEEK